MFLVPLKWLSISSLNWFSQIYVCQEGYLILFLFCKSCRYYLTVLIHTCYSYHYDAFTKLSTEIIGTVDAHSPWRQFLLVKEAQNFLNLLSGFRDYSTFVKLGSVVTRTRKLIHVPHYTFIILLKRLSYHTLLLATCNLKPKFNFNPSFGTGVT